MSFDLTISLNLFNKSVEDSFHDVGSVLWILSQVEVFTVLMRRKALFLNALGFERESLLKTGKKAMFSLMACLEHDFENIKCIKANFEVVNVETTGRDWARLGTGYSKQGFDKGSHLVLGG
jgi:hypothetical protein